MIQSFFLGEQGLDTQIYKEGDDELNSKSEYAMAILKTLPSRSTIESSDSKKGETPKTDATTKPKQTVHPQQNQNKKSQMKDANRLSPTARTFVSRRSPPLPIQVSHAQTIAGPVFTPKTIPSWDHSRKAYWQPAPIYDHVQAHNYILAHEIARFEAHMQAQRIALHTHYYKSPFHQVRRPVGQYNPITSTPAQNNGHLRVQVVA